MSDDMPDYVRDAMQIASAAATREIEGKMHPNANVDISCHVQSAMGSVFYALMDVSYMQMSGAFARDLHVVYKAQVK